MAKYCTQCQRDVTPKRKIGVGFFILTLLTGGIWLMAFPFQPKRCPICLGTTFGRKVPVIVGAEVTEREYEFVKESTPLEKLEKLSKLKESGVLTDAEFQEQKTKLLKLV